MFATRIIFPWFIISQFLFILLFVTLFRLQQIGREKESSHHSHNVAENKDRHERTNYLHCIGGSALSPPLSSSSHHDAFRRHHSAYPQHDDVDDDDILDDITPPDSPELDPVGDD